MDIILLIIFFGIAGLILVGLPLRIAYSLWNKGRYTKYIVLPCLIGYTYMWYTAFYPTDSFYIDHLETFTGVAFGEDAEVIKKYAGFPDPHGDYPACALVIASPEILKRLSELHPAGYTEINSSESSISCIEPRQGNFEKVYYKESIGEIIYWGFNAKTREVFFDYSSY